MNKVNLYKHKICIVPIFFPWYVCGVGNMTHTHSQLIYMFDLIFGFFSKKKIIPQEFSCLQSTYMIIYVLTLSEDSNVSWCPNSTQIHSVKLTYDKSVVNTDTSKIRLLSKYEDTNLKRKVTNSIAKRKLSTVDHLKWMHDSQESLCLIQNS